MKLYLHVCCSACRASRSSDGLPSFPQIFIWRHSFGGNSRQQEPYAYLRQLVRWRQDWRHTLRTQALRISIAYSWTRSSKCAPASMRHNSNWTTPSLLRDPLRSLPIVANLLTYLHDLYASTQRLRSTQVDATFAYVRKIFKETWMKPCSSKQSTYSI